MNLFEELKKDMIDAMKAKDKDRLTVIRMLKAALDKERIDVSVKWGYNIFGRRVSVLERKIINYIVVCINEFALSKNLTEQEAFRYLYANKGIEFLTENYDVEHTLSLQDAVNDLSIVCRNNGGMIQ